MTVSGIVGPVLVYFDRFAIGAWLGAAAVGFYVIGYNLISQMQTVPGAFARAIFPRLAELNTDDSLVRSNDAMRIMVALVTPMTIAAMFAMWPFLHLWLGPEISRVTGPVTILLLIGFWTNATAFVCLTCLQAMGRPDLSAKVHVAELLPYGILLYGGIHTAGLAGAAAVWSFRCTLDLLLLSHLGGQLRGIMRELLVGALLVGASATATLVIGAPLAYWTIAITLGLLSTAWAWALVPDHLRALAASFARHPLSFGASPP